MDSVLQGAETSEEEPKDCLFPAGMFDSGGYMSEEAKQESGLEVIW